MSDPVEERKQRLQKGIDSPSTPDHVREEMKAMLERLNNPEPPPPPAKVERRGNPAFQKGKKNPYYEKKGKKPSFKKKTEPTPEPIVEPPPLPERVLTEDEKREMRETYARRRERKKNQL